MWFFNSKASVKIGIFLITGRSQNVVPIHKKGDMQHLQNYQPVSLLPICGKIFARIILKFIFKYLEKIAFSVQINLVFVHLTHVKTSYYQSFMTLKLILINIQLLGGMIFQKTLTKCGMQGFSYWREWRESPH